MELKDVVAAEVTTREVLNPPGRAPTPAIRVLKVPITLYRKKGRRVGIGARKRLVLKVQQPFTDRKVEEWDIDNSTKSANAMPGKNQSERASH